jgi:hypothetical protein
LSESIIITKCLEDSAKYSDAVIVLAAIREILIKNPSVGKFFGIERTITTLTNEKITPDLIATYDDERNCIFFELKWAVSQRTIKDELLDLKRYFSVNCKLNVSSTVLEHNDVILICHVEDTKIVVNSIKELTSSPDNDFLKPDNLAVWSWAFIKKKKTSKDFSDEMRLNCEYGKTKNNELEKFVNEPGGIPVPADVLQYLRSKFLFVVQKPPIQYTMKVLLMHVFPSYSSNLPKGTAVDLQIDAIYNNMKSLFPGWRNIDSETIQAKKQWIMEALYTFKKIGFDITSLPHPIRKSYDEWICGKLEKFSRKERRYAFRTRGIRKVNGKGYSKIDKYFS